MGLHVCVQSPGTIFFCLYLCFACCLSSSLFSMSHAWGRPYTSFRISLYLLLFVVALSCRFYSFMILSCMSHNFSLIYLYRVMGIFR